MGEAKERYRLILLVFIVRHFCLAAKHYSYSIFGHSVNTADIAALLACKSGANANISICRIAGLLHDICAIINGRNNHHIDGAKFSRKLLKALGFPKKLINGIGFCVLWHRGSVEVSADLTPEAIIIRVADSLSHFYRVDELWRVGRYDKQKSPYEAYVWLLEKFWQDWQKIPDELRPMAKPYYDHALARLSELYCIDSSRALL